MQSFGAICIVVVEVNVIIMLRDLTKPLDYMVINFMGKRLSR